jgi:hypothetical protein
MMGGTQEDEGGGREEKLTGRARGMESWPGSRFIGQAAAGWDDAMTVRTYQQLLDVGPEIWRSHLSVTSRYFTSVRLAI